mmetsp:Transcript_2452/g.3851  ORF Transcript_2452/g.3851 Transcript_2452/m.3851 type:complete len:203 (+) Transcript_2452:56-664(+)
MRANENTITESFFNQSCSMLDSDPIHDEGRVFIILPSQSKFVARMLHIFSETLDGCRSDIETRTQEHDSFSLLNWWVLHEIYKCIFTVFPMGILVLGHVHKVKDVLEAKNTIKFSHQCCLAPGFREPIDHERFHRIKFLKVGASLVFTMMERVIDVTPSSASQTHEISLFIPVRLCTPVPVKLRRRPCRVHHRRKSRKRNIT